MKTLHKIAYSFFYPIIILLLKLKFGYSFEKATNLPDTYIVLSNHVTDWDPLFVASSFPRQMYFVASEHIARWKVAYTFLKTLFAPIMRYKGTVASSTVKEVFRKVKDALMSAFSPKVSAPGMALPIRFCLPLAKWSRAAAVGLSHIRLSAAIL